MCLVPVAYGTCVTVVVRERVCVMCLKGKEVLQPLPQLTFDWYCRS